MNEKISEVIDLLALDCNNTELSLYSGIGGQALLRYISGKLKSSAEDDFNFEIIERIAENVISSSSSPVFTFANGISGTSWLFHYLKKENYIDLDENFFGDIDEIIANAAFKYLSNGDYDFLHGAGGIIFSLLMRPQDNKRKLKLLTKYLLESRIEFDGYKVWEYRSGYVHTDKIKINLGMAHGIPSVMVLLSKLYINHILPGDCLAAINEAWLFIKNQKNKCPDETNFSFYPTLVISGEENVYRSRLGWCYGDLGIGIALYVAGSNIQNEGMKEEAINIYRYYSGFINEPKLLVRDSSLCHGAAGVMHLYSRMYHNTQDVTFKKTADYWLSALMNMAHHKDGLAGYKVWNENGWEVSTSLVEGIAGVGIALSSYLQNEIPDWDQCFLIS